ncbi:2-dehydro-3-deoxyphosphogluconate aldolase/(4S)-4-hydroxy-2-oxoglutarate aldolase [Motilibacter rhizosphaerae]|uniref:2-dehydro-3-deoxy-phosphogluconate aldolase n=1 Tax=Motilibacter rhizosphaerae TaxID=598652 RepID=A0A4Q7NWG9_9ACTN|nr:bifunctional 4-hydroxy-2-oxoglutarate aldolase/2-dehydro-3-deoxy-phosphogluconate aldolase [Motilibacter rhizosphaerae]RZS91656.1 2-dehydro-3-deoxyphosphogluconate aldolase/(4S)-4-hydroxy-2-oxoglutarate aldolase [Motilibacter rhizosphaerae]
MSDPGTELVQALAPCPLLPVLVVGGTDGAQLARALREGGVRAAEVTLRTPQALDVLAACAGQEDLLVGAGTVLDPDDVDAAAAAGARFVVSPGLDLEVVERAHARGLAAVPGVQTASEVQRAHRAGLRLLKFFPAATSGGPRAVAALGGPFGAMRFVPTGGISAADARSYLELPNVVGVGGSWFVPPALVDGLGGPTAYAALVDSVRTAVGAVA